MESLLFTAVMVTAGAVLCFLGVYSLSFRKIPTAIAFSAFMFACAGWSLTYALDSTLTDLAAKTLLFQVEFVFIILIPFLSLITMIAYIGRSDLLNRKFIAIILALPMISILLDLTNGYFHLFTASFTLLNTGPFTVLLDSPGPYFIVYLLSSYGYLLTGLFLIIRHTIASEGIYRRQDLLVLIGLAVPLVGEVLYQLGITVAKGVSISPALFVITGAMLAFAMFRFKLFELVPIAKGALMSHSPDPILVLDDKHQLVELNLAALKMFDLKKERVVGKTVGETFREHAQMVEMFQAPSPGSFEVSISVREEERIFDSRIIPMNGPSNKPIGTLVIMRDITLRKSVENEVKLSEARYRGLLENAPFPAFIVSMNDGRILFTNSRGETLMGMPRETLLGKPAANYAAVFKDQKRLAELLAADGRFDDVETAFLDGRGEGFWARLSGSLITFEKEQVIFIAINDISHLKLAGVLKLANRKLNLLTEITRNELLNKFMVINGYLEILDLVNGETEKRQILGNLRDASLAAQRIIRFTESFQKLGMEPPGWMRVSEHICLARSLGLSEGVKVEQECGSLKLFADPLLKNVFLSLVEFILRHSTTLETIKIRYEQDETGVLRLLFEDDSGSESATNEDLFVYHSGKEELLALFMAKEILNMTGIEIRQSQYGEKARFVISIPADKYDF